METKKFELTPEKKLEILKALQEQDFEKMNRKQKREYLRNQKKRRTRDGR